MTAAGGPPGPRDYALLLALASLWGGSFLLIKVAVGVFPPASVSAGRLAIAAVALTAFTLASGRALPTDGRTWAKIAGVAVLGNALPFTLIAWGESRIDSGAAAIVMGINPLVTLGLAHIFTQDEKFAANKLLGLLLGLAGVVVLIGPEKLLVLADDTLHYLAVAGAACCYAAASMVNKRLTGGESFRAVSAGVFLVSAAIMVPASLALDRPWTLEVSGQAAMALILLGLFPTALGNILLLTIIRRQGAAFFSQINYLVPVFGLVWGVLLLGEEPPAAAFAALALILGGIAFARKARTGPRDRAAPDAEG